TSFTNTLATSNTGASDPIPSCQGSIGHTIFFQFTPGTSGPYIVDTCGATFDTVLAVYTGGPCGPFAEIACDDDSGGSLTSTLTPPLSPGTTYTTMVAGFSANSGTGTLHITFIPPPPPNDSCSNPAFARVGSVPYNNLAASAELSDPVLCATSSGK